MPSREGARVFLGNLPTDIRERDIEKFFDRYGRVRNIFVKNGKYGFCVSPQSTNFSDVLKFIRQDTVEIFFVCYKKKMSRRRPTCRVYIGNIPSSVHLKDIEHMFRRYTRRFDVLLKNGFAFVVSANISFCPLLEPNHLLQLRR